MRQARVSRRLSRRTRRLPELTKLLMVRRRLRRRMIPPERQMMVVDMSPVSSLVNASDVEERATQPTNAELTDPNSTARLADNKVTMLQELSSVESIKEEMTECQGVIPEPGTPGSSPETEREDASTDLTAEMVEDVTTDLAAEITDTSLGEHRRDLNLPEVVGGTGLLFQAGGTTLQVRLSEVVLRTGPGQPGLAGGTTPRRAGTG